MGGVLHYRGRIGGGRRATTNVQPATCTHALPHAHMPCYMPQPFW